MNIGNSRIPFLFFFIVASLGTLLRSPLINAIPVSYSHLIHAHSHTAFQGWIYLALFILSTKLFLTNEQIKSRKYVLQFYISSITIVGIFISFSLQGYGLFSIIFSTIFQLLNYWFFRSFILDTRKEYSNKRPLSLKFMYAGIVLGILSTLAPIAIGILSAKGYKGTELYESTIYYFLHFQYNGWFLFTSIGIFFRSLEEKSVTIDMTLSKRFYRLMLIAVFPALALSYLGMSFRNLIFPLAIIAIILEIAAVLVFVKIIKHQIIKWYQSVTTLGRLFIQFVFASYLLRTLMLLISLHPSFVEIAFQNRLSVIFFLHLILIGILTFHIIAQFYLQKWIHENKLSNLGGILLISGFVLTEFVLAMGSIELFYNQRILLIGSIAMTIGIAFIAVNLKKRRNL